MMMTKNKKIIKNIVLCTLIIILFITLLYFTIWENLLRDRVLYAVKGKQEREIITSIEINDVKLPFDKDTKTFYYPVNDSDDGKSITLDIEIVSKKQARYIINNQEFNKNIQITVDIDFGKPIEIYSSTDYIYNKYYIKFTNLPIIHIDSVASKIDSEYAYSSVNIIDPKYEENESEYSLESDINIRIRGASARYADKKSYRMRIVDEVNNKKNISLFGMRNDSDWILDSLYIDDSYIRNGLSYDLWNLVNSDINDEYKVEFKWQFVEIFMEDEYQGLYVLKEPIDEDTLNLTKTSNSNSGVLLKGRDHFMPDFTEENIKNIKDNIYYGFEIKYPKDLKDNSQYWYKILSKMKNYYTDNLSDQIIEDTFYMDNFVNYRLFILALQANDNYEPKNVYISLKNLNNETKLLLTPWDLDLTYGILWDNEIGNVKSYNRVEEIMPLNTENSPNYVKELKSRWTYLRKEVFNETVMNNLIDKYEKELTLSGAAKRNYIKWEKDTDIVTELNEIRQWCPKRFTAVDQYINGL